MPPFQTRNPYYLRISEKNVVPVYLYLDERHLDWMSDRVFQHVLADLRPHVLSKMKAEATMRPALSSKKATVDTHRGETYQFCYFFRKNEPHSVVVKSRDFVAHLPQLHSAMTLPSASYSKQQRGKRKIKVKGPGEHVRKKRKARRKGNARIEDNELSSSSCEILENTSRKNPPRPPEKVPKDVFSSGYMELDDQQVANPEGLDHERSDFPTRNPSNMDIDQQAPQQPIGDVDQEDEKPKLKLQLKYQGFEIYGHCLCIVVEPWPPIRAPSKLPSAPETTSRGSGNAPPGYIPSPDSRRRETTPLFLPDLDQERSESRRRPQISSLLDPSFLDDSDDSDYGGMMEFSQVLNAAGDLRAGAADDDEDTDAAMFFGDADEVKEL